MTDDPAHTRDRFNTNYAKGRSVEDARAAVSRTRRLSSEAGEIVKAQAIVACAHIGLGARETANELQLSRWTVGRFWADAATTGVGFAQHPSSAATVGREVRSAWL